MQKIENIKTWLNALESGEYKQNHGHYYNDETVTAHCCLHVAYMLGEGRSLYDSIQSGDHHVGGLRGAENYLGEDFLNTQLDDHPLPVLTVTELIRMNDERKKPFTEIASWVRTTFNIPKD